MKFSRKHGLFTSHRIRKNAKGKGYIKSNSSLPYCTECNKRPCCGSIYEETDFLIKSKKSLKKSKQYSKNKISKWARKPF